MTESKLAELNEQSINQVHGGFAPLSDGYPVIPMPAPIDPLGSIYDQIVIDEDYLR